MAEPAPLREVLAAGAKAARTAIGLRQEDAAARVRELGLSSWLRGTVAQVEVGARRLTVEELVVLALAYETTPAAFIVGMDDDLVELTDAAQARKADMRALWSGQVVTPQAESRGRRGVAQVARERLRGGQDSATEADRRAARRLGLSLEEATRLGLKLWGRTLAEERDRRLAERVADLSPRQLQALRGHVTRDHKAELDESKRTTAQPATRPATTRTPRRSTG